jgi:hypothetical protein
MPDSRRIDRWLIAVLALFALVAVGRAIWERDSIRRWDPARIGTFTPRLYKIRSEHLRHGDRALIVNGQPIRSRRDWDDAMQQARPGVPLRLRVSRDGAAQEVQVQPAYPAGEWWEPLVALLGLIPFLIWLNASGRLSSPLSRWSRTGLLAGPVLVILLRWLSWDGPAWWLGSLYGVVLPLLLGWSISEARWAHVAGALLTVASAVLMGAEICFPTYDAVPPGWGEHLDFVEQLLPLNLYFWIALPFSSWSDPEPVKPASG